MVDSPSIPPSGLPGNNNQSEHKGQLQVPPIMWKGKVFWDSDNARKFWSTLSQQVNKDIQKQHKKMKKAMKKMSGDSNDDDSD